MDRLKKAALAVALVIVTPVAMAFDATGATTYIEGGMTTGVTAIGAALLVIAATAVGFKWGKAMIFG